MLGRLISQLLLFLNDIRQDLLLLQGSQNFIKVLTGVTHRRQLFVILGITFTIVRKVRGCTYSHRLSRHIVTDFPVKIRIDYSPARQVFSFVV